MEVCVVAAGGLFFHQRLAQGGTKETQCGWMGTVGHNVKLSDSNSKFTCSRWRSVQDCGLCSSRCTRMPERSFFFTQ